jgi:site-specific recombinase XerD
MSESEPKSGRQLTVTRPARDIVAEISARVVIPAMIVDAGERATRRYLEFFAATIRNKNTRTAYLHAVSRFFAWCDHHQIGQLADIEPLHVAAYIEALGKDFEKPTVKQHLAAIRMLFDWLVTGQVVATNPAHSVRGPKHVVKTGKTTVLDAEQARKLLDSIKIVRPQTLPNGKVETLPDGTVLEVPCVVGLRDRALISVMTFAFARIGAVVAMRLEDYYPKGKRWWVRLHEKGGKRHEMPAHHTLEAYIDAYIEAAGIRDGGKTPLFRSAAGRTGTLTEKPMNRVDVWRMIQRRAGDLGMRIKIGCHTFRATGITAYLEAGGTLENAQAMAAHESPRTTKLYDRTGDEITLDEIERISI